jgi:release factor glutamine methyltransferase
MTRPSVSRPSAQSEPAMAEPIDAIGSAYPHFTGDPSSSPPGLRRDLSAASALAWAERTLAGAQVDTPRLDAELLLCQALEWTRARLYAHPEHTLSEGEHVDFLRLVRRRTAREPLAYLLGRKEFYGLEFLVDHRVLIPRPETELLVELAIRRLEGVQSVPPAPAVADVGTGSGAIAIALARHTSAIRVHALDVSAEALEVARANCHRHGVTMRVELLRGDLLAPLESAVDLIVGNLPYVTRTELDTLPPEISTYEPRVALDGGADGLDVLRRLLGQAGEHLRFHGGILLEIGAEQGPEARTLAARYFPAASIEVHRDLSGLDRILEIDTSRSTGG